MVDRPLDDDALPEGPLHSSEWITDQTKDITTASLGSAPMAEIEDTNRPGGWMARASVPGGLAQMFCAHEPDDKSRSFGKNGGNKR